jgi:hypothetical protein
VEGGRSLEKSLRNRPPNERRPRRTAVIRSPAGAPRMMTVFV